MIRKIIFALMLASAAMISYSCDEKPGYVNDEYDPLNPNKKPENEEPDNGEAYYPKAEGSFRIMAYNIGHFFKSNYNSTKDIAKMIKEVEADVVGLNELDSCNTRSNVNQVAMLAAELGWNWHFGRAMEYRGGAYGNGVVVPKNQTIESRYTVTLPKGTGSEQRSIAVVETEKYVIGAAHLDHTNDAAVMGQVEVVNNWAQTTYYNSKKPVFFVGDMNSTPDSEAVKALEKVWTRLSSTEPSIPVVAPTKCIDFVFHYKKSAPVTVTGTHTMTKFRSADVTKTSDHLPVYADVKF